MIYFKSIFNCKFNLQLSLFAVAFLLCLSPMQEVKASDLETAVNLTCPSSKSKLQRRFTTAKFDVYICSGDTKNPLGYYVRISKAGGNPITLPLARRNGETYVAVNDELLYAVTPYEQVVTKKKRLILLEKVDDATDEEGKALVRGCREGEKSFVSAQTQSYFVYICGGDTPTNYVAIARNGNRRITLPLQRYDTGKGSGVSKYIAVEDNSRYTLTEKVLRITQDGKNVIKEKILRWE